jgi:hypothetical protein
VLIPLYFLRVSGVVVSVAAAKRDSLSFPRSIVDRCTAGCSRQSSIGDICSANAFVVGVSLCCGINIWFCINMLCR